MATTPAPRNYINNGHSLASWLLTRDHKRIALLYLISITFFFFLGGFFALMIRLELLTPAADLVEPDMYNRLFTMHGVVMVFFFLIPSIPSVLGNFLVPLMIGAKDLAFPKLNLASWYIYMIGWKPATTFACGLRIDSRIYASSIVTLWLPLTSTCLP